VGVVSISTGIASNQGLRIGEEGCDCKGAMMAKTWSLKAVRMSVAGRMQGSAMKAGELTVKEKRASWRGERVKRGLRSTPPHSP
jgi:hypothetical protein